VQASLHLRGGGGMRDALAEQFPLQSLALVFVLGLALVTLTPTPFLVDQLGAARGMRLLTILSTSSAAAEILLSPVAGTLTDSVGRKPVLLASLLTAFAATAGAAAMPTVAIISASKFVSSLSLGMFFLSAGTMLADNYRMTPTKLAAASGLLFAIVNGGFGLGVALSVLLPPSVRQRYIAGAVVLLTSVGLAALAVPETLPRQSRAVFKVPRFNPFSGARLLQYDRRMQLLVLLASLLLAPLFMGDTMQVYAITQWKLNPAQVSQLFTAMAISGVVANSASGMLIKTMGLRNFSLLATASSLLGWSGFLSSARVALVCTAVGLLGTARTLGAVTMMTAHAGKLGIPQGQVAGDRSNLIAWLKVLGPIIYGQLYVQGFKAGAPQLPFVLNVILMLVALCLTPFALPSIAQVAGS